MFFTQIKLNTARRETIKLLDSKQRIHAAILAGFPDLKEDRLLWRLDDNSRHDIIIYVVSPQKPDYTNFWEKYGWERLPYEQTIKTVDYTKLLNHLENGQKWGFKLNANTVKSVERKRIPVEESEIKNWLMHRTENNGFTVNTNDFNAHTTVNSFYKNNKNGNSKNKVTLQETIYQGILEITDRELFKQVLTMGIGKAKSYGCGLITLSK